MSATYYEDDFQATAAPAGPGRFLPGTSVEIVRELTIRRPFRHVLFDFDGTLSLIREGWVEVMTPLMVEELLATRSGESPQQIEALVREFVTELTGKQTIYQMIRLAEEVAKRGGRPRDPMEYKRLYHDRLMQRIAGRREALRTGRASPDDMLVSYSRNLLDELRTRGAVLYVASGTDECYVVEEVALLGLADYFGPHVYGARDDYRTFSKALVIERILAENCVPGEQLLGFGDGYVEIQNVKAVGGVAVAVASDEAGRSGRPDAWKRQRLIGAGADVVIPDYADYQALLRYLSSNNELSCH